MVPVRIAAVLVLLLLWSACAQPVRPVAMVPRSFDVERSFPHSVGVSVAGGEETNPLWRSKISGPDYLQALRQALRRSKLFSSVATSGAADYHLRVELLEVDQPMGGVNITVTLTSSWALTRLDASEPVFAQTVSTPFTATFGQAVIGDARFRLANEGAARKNIKDGIQRLSRIDLARDRPQ